MRALVIEHQADAPSGVLGEWLRDEGFEVVMWRPEGEPDPPDPADVDLVVSLGSRHSVYDDLDWIAAEVALLRRATALDTPVLGICFGSQALATALGGGVAPAPGPEIGWVEVEPGDPGALPAGPWLAWHSDASSLPPGATELARNAAGLQAFRLGPHLGVQFHPEVTPEIVEGWIAAHPEQLDTAGLDAGELRAATSLRAATARVMARRLFDAFWAGRLAGEPAYGPGASGREDSGSASTG